jgi:hypothetical protein
MTSSTRPLASRSTGGAGTALTKISSRFTYWNKRVFPILWFGFIAVFVATTLVSGVVAKDLMFLIVPCAMAVFGFFMMRKLVWDLVDEVYDGGDYLLVKNRGNEIQVALSNIMNVSATTHMNPARIVIRLREPSRFGSEIAFSPAYKFTLNPFAKNAVAEDLISRVDRARTPRPAGG